MQDNKQSSGEKKNSDTGNTVS
eukprot:IDg7983t1